MVPLAVRGLAVELAHDQAQCDPQLPHNETLRNAIPRTILEKPPSTFDRVQFVPSARRVSVLGGNLWHAFKIGVHGAFLEGLSKLRDAR